MKKKYIFQLLLGGGLLFANACDMKVIDNPVAITPDNATNAAGTVALVANALKNGFEAYQQMNWAAGLVGQEELRSIGQSGQFLFANRIAQEGIVAADNSQNATIARRAYTTFALVTDALDGIQKNTFSTTPAQDAKAKALLTANAKAIEGVLYANLCKFYEQIPEPGTGNLLPPDEAKNRAIRALQEAKAAFVQYSAAAVPDPVVGGASVATGLLGNTNRSGEKLCDSYIGMLHFDTGTRDQAATFLANGYTPADQATQAGYRVINALSGPGLYPPAVNYVAFSVNDYATGFLNERIPGDVNRRGAALNWFDATISLATRINYFYPVPPGAGAITPVVLYPLITWQEVALMRAELGQVDAAQTVQQVLQSWGVPAVQAQEIAADRTAYPLERIARYEYVGRGRRWSAVNAQRPNTYRRWPIAQEFNVK